MRYSTFSLVRNLFFMIVTATLVGCTAAWAQTEKTLWDFNATDGWNPMAGLVFDSSGNLYGTTYNGGTGQRCGQGCGVVFQLTPNGDGTWSEAVIHNFTNHDDGAEPYTPLIVDHYGNLYGTTSSGGTNQWGNVFKMSPSSGGTWTESVLYSFAPGSGATMNGGLTLGAGGRLYGAAEGGVNYNGFIFVLAQVSALNWHELVINSFPQYGQNGVGPNGSLIFDPHGNLYGTTEAGGTNCCGTVFKLTPNTLTFGWTETVLYSFRGNPYGPDGSDPDAGVVFDSQGNLYGTTLQGGGVCNPSGTPCGTVFKLTPQANGTWSESVIHTFQGGPADGSGPGGPVIVDSAGNLYGTTGGGGTYAAGTVYKLTPSADGQWTETILWSFTGQHDGANPNGGLIMDSAGNLYGTTANGGGIHGENIGAVFEIIP